MQSFKPRTSNLYGSPQNQHATPWDTFSKSLSMKISFSLIHSSWPVYQMLPYSLQQIVNFNKWARECYLGAERRKQIENKNRFKMHNAVNEIFRNHGRISFILDLSTSNQYPYITTKISFETTIAMRSAV